MDQIKALFKISGPHLDRDEILVSPIGLRVGRSADNDLPLDHGEISRHHMRIIWRDGAYWVEDLNSSNGVWLNDLRIRPNVPYELKRGDVIRCGPYTFTYIRLIVPTPQTMVSPPPEAIVPPEGLPTPPTPTPEVAPAPSTPTETDGSGGDPSGNGQTGPIAAVSLPPLPRPIVPGPPESYANGAPPDGIPLDKSNWLQYLPAIYSDDDFLGRYLLIFESIMSPIIWAIDSLDLLFTPEMAPADWLRWMGEWFDLLLVPELPIERQRAIMSQIGWLFLRRSTRAGLERLLELYFGVKPEIIEDPKEPCHFVVELPLSKSNTALGRDVAERLIQSQKPAFASFTLEIT